MKNSTKIIFMKELVCNLLHNKLYSKKYETDLTDEQGDVIMPLFVNSRLERRTDSNPYNRSCRAVKALMRAERSKTPDCHRRNRLSSARLLGNVHGNLSEVEKDMRRRRLPRVISHIHNLLKRL